MNPGDIFRVDDRLIHGQVMVGWVIAQDINELILVSDRIALDSWQREAFTVAVKVFSDNTSLIILSKKEAVSFVKPSLPEPHNFILKPCRRRRMIVVESVSDAVELFRLGFKIITLNLGGVHMRAGREMILPYLYLDSKEMKAILELSEAGVKIVAKDLPKSKEIDVVNLIKQKKNG